LQKEAKDKDKESKKFSTFPLKIETEYNKKPMTIKNLEHYDDNNRFNQQKGQKLEQTRKILHPNDGLYKMEIENKYKDY